MAGELKVNLVLVTEAAKAALKEFMSSAGLVGGGKSFLGDTGSASRDVADISRNIASGGKATSKMVSDLDKISSISVSLGGKGKSNLALSPKLLAAMSPEDRAFFQKKGESNGEALQEGIEKAAKNPKYKGVYWTSKEMLGNPRLPDVSKFLPKGKDESRRLAMDLLGKRGSQDMIDFQAAAAQSDFDFNNKKTIKYKGATPPKLADVERERLKKMGLGVITAMFNPWIGSRLLSDAVGGGAGGKGGSVARGIFGSGGAFGFAEFYILITGIKKGLQIIGDVFKWGAEQMRKSIEFAHQLFAKSLESGLNIRFTALRQMTAQTLGVDERDIFRFAQSAMVMRQLSGAANELAKDAPQLAYTAAQFKILEFDALALGSKISTKLLPPLNGFINILDKLITTLTKSKILNVIEAGLMAEFPKLTAAFAALSVAGGKNQTLGQPQTFMKQLPVGAFEKMGLIIGGGMADKALEYQRRTATAVEKLVQAATKTNQKTGGLYMSRSPYVAGY